MGIDNAFLRLSPDFDQAKNGNDPKQSRIAYKDSIRLRTDENYLQITNSSVDIVFNNDYQVLLIDCNEITLLDITKNVTIAEFIDKYGVRQIAFEIVNIGREFGEIAYLKFIHTEGESVFYSNGFRVLDQSSEFTLRIDYKSYGMFADIDYANAPYMQSIRISGGFETSEDNTEVSQYIQVDGNVYSQNPISNLPDTFEFNLIDNHTFRSFAFTLKHDIVYIDGVRSTNRPALKNSQRNGYSNLTSATATLNRDYTQTYNSPFILTMPLQFQVLFPLGNVSADTISGKMFQITFNKPVTIVDGGTIRLYSGSGILLAEFSSSDLDYNGSQNVVVTSGVLVTDYATNFGAYYLKMDAGLFYSEINETISITNTRDWRFTIGNGDYDSNDYSTDYNI